jgi:phospholipid-binding lipoprotein MlaA
MKIALALNRLASLLFALMMTACASMQTASSIPRDPFENFNRSMFLFNTSLDENVIKPVATGYADYVPSFIRTAVGNFLGNLGDVWTAVNNYLQGKPRDGSSDVGRVALNSTFGLLGLIDVATPIGLPKHDEDLGQTLGVWGVKSGPYLVLPFFGASTVRDGVAKLVDLFYGDTLNYIGNQRLENTSRVVRVIDDRAAFLDSSSLMEIAALDPYQFYRDAYLQRREARVRDGRDANERD